MGDDLIMNLEDEHFIAAGLFCRCYENPSDRAECVKIPVEGKKAKKRLDADLNYYHKLHKRNVGLEYIADYLGKCATNLGDGYRYECVRDFDQGISRTLKFYLEESDVEKAKIYDLFTGLGEYLLDNRILISDLHSKNVLIQLKEGGVMVPVIVDGIGDRVAITILNVFPKLEKAKIKRRWNRFARKALDGNAVLSEDR